MNASLDIVSCGVSPLIPPHLRACIEQAEVLFGSRTLLKAFPQADRTTVVIGANARQDAEHALALFRAGKRVVVLASGDALYHGFGGTLARLLHTAHGVNPAVRYHPNITAFQALFHRLQLPWDDARLFCAHQDSDFSLREVVEAPLAVLYGGSRTPAHELAARLVAFYPAAATRPAVMAEHVCDPNAAPSRPAERAERAERIVHGTLATLATVPVAPTSILVLLQAPCALPLALGLPEEDYERENNLITPSDVRAVVLARLRLPASGVLWDIGAGSGSVGLEAAALRPRLHVVAVEKNPERVALIDRNRLRLGVSNHTTLQADVSDLTNLAALTKRPPPDRIFVGGGGLPAVLNTCFAALSPGGRLLVSAVTLETVHRLYAWSPEHRTDLTALDISHEHTLAGRYHHLKAQNRITLFTFCKPDNAV